MGHAVETGKDRRFVDAESLVMLLRPAFPESENNYAIISSGLHAPAKHSLVECFAIGNLFIQQGDNYAGIGTAG